MSSALPAAWHIGRAASNRSPFDPAGRVHIPIGIPDTLDTLKTFVEAEGCFSPGVGTYGINYWLRDLDRGVTVAPTFDDIGVTHGLAPGGALIPWSEWHTGGVAVRTEVAHVERQSPRGAVHIVASRAAVTNKSNARRRVALYVGLRPTGPAGWDVAKMSVQHKDVLAVNDRPAVVAKRKPSQAGVLDTDTVDEVARTGAELSGKTAVSSKGDCSGGFRFDLTLEPGATETVPVICPVLPGRRAARHLWAFRGGEAMVDVAELNPDTGGILQPDPGAAWYRSLEVENLFDDAARFWAAYARSIDLHLPEPRWAESMKVILAHAGLCMNEGAPDVAVVNYNVYNRDGMYIANMMQKAGLEGYSQRVADYFLRHPFNGRAWPEADNPGQILWALHQHWLLSRDRVWLTRIFADAEKIGRMIRYYRSTPGPHWVDPNSLRFGRDVPEAERQELKPGRCDGFHPEYTEAFDIAGLRALAGICDALGRAAAAEEWSQLANRLLTEFDEKFGGDLGRDYGSYSVLWPCRLYPLNRGKAHDRFRGVGPKASGDWRYFPLATAHQGLLAGAREAAWKTLELHLGHEQMQGWYAFDEGGPSGSGGWPRTRTTWTHSRDKPGQNLSVSMPHGWAIAEFWLLMRDSLVFEDGKCLVLLGGIPPEWFRAPDGIAIRRLPTYFGALDLEWTPDRGASMLKLGGNAAPPDGFVLRLPAGGAWTADAAGRSLKVDAGGDCRIPPGTTLVRMRSGRGD